MTLGRTFLLTVAASTCLATAAFADGQPASQPMHEMHDMEAAHEWHHLTKASATLYPTAGSSAHGTIRFEAAEDGVKVVADLEGLEPNSTHGIHIHEYGDCSSGDGKSAGGHYNPEGYDHALPGTEMRHAGDLGNLEADASGVAHYEIVVHNITISGTKNPIVGRGVIVHALADDGGQPTGNAGGRIACGVIGIAK